MEWFIAVVAVLALGAAAVAAAGGFGELPPPVRDTYAATLPDGPLSADALQGLRFGVTLRGYAMDQVDDLLDRLAAEIEARDARIAELTGVRTPARVALEGWAGAEPDRPAGEDQRTRPNGFAPPPSSAEPEPEPHR